MILQSLNDGYRAAALLEAKRRWNKDLVGTKDGVNQSFTIPDPEFVQIGETVIRVFYNGQRLRLGSGNDYTVSESGGVGTGYDTVTLVGVAPFPQEELTADYLVP